jgi:hypothetical protein
VQLLDERGNGELYLHPAKLRERYISLPNEYWRRDLDRDLDLPGKAVLLIARSLNPEGFTLPLAQADAWYGISPDTLRRGMRQLVKARLATHQAGAVESAQAPRAITIRRTYRLAGPVARTDAHQHARG